MSRDSHTETYFFTTGGMPVSWDHQETDDRIELTLGHHRFGDLLMLYVDSPDLLTSLIENATAARDVLLAARRGLVAEVCANR